MSWVALFCVVIVILFILMLLGEKIAFALGLAAMAGFFITKDPQGLSMIGNATWQAITSYELTAVPLFILMGEIVVACNLSSRFYRGATAVFGRIPGGFLQTNIITCAIFAAISGSSVATAASIGSIAYPELDKRGYDKRMNIGSLAAGGALGILIPPSVSFLIYGSLTHTSIPKLFMAGLIPGLLAVFIFMVYIFVRVKKNPRLAPPLGPKSTKEEAVRGLVDMLPFVVLMLLVLGSIYAGVCTPTEAAALSVFVAVLIAAIYHEFSPKRLYQAAFAACKSSCMVFYIVVCSQVFTTFVSKSGIGRKLVSWFVSMDPNPLVFFLILCVIYLVLGCLMDGTSIVYLTVPVLFPLVTSIGFDPIWFGVILVILIEVGMLTPPVGMNLFVLLGITGKTATFKDAATGSLPYVFMYLGVVFILYFLPIIATWLPSTM